VSHNVDRYTIHGVLWNIKFKMQSQQPFARVLDYNARRLL
jgi:hypothetical protein